MKFDELYKFIGYSLVCLFLFYIVSKSIRFQLGIIEGLAGIKQPKINDDLVNQMGAGDDVHEDENELVVDEVADGTE